MRVTDNLRFQAVSRSLSTLGQRQAELARQASSGKRVDAPSTDPIAAADMTRVRSGLAQVGSHRKTINTVRSDAELADGMLAEASALFIRAKEIALQGANDSLSASDRAMLADEISQLKEHLVSVANTKGGRGYLFGGTATGGPAFDATGAFLGNDLDQIVAVGPGVTTRVNVSGADAFTAAGGRDVFADLDALRAGLLADDTTAIAGTLDHLEASRAQIVRAQADAGLIMNRLETSDASLAQTELAMRSREASIGDADPFETFSNLTRVSQAIEQAITVARSTLNNSLLRF